jgi:hypothetical protein
MVKISLLRVNDRCHRRVLKKYLGKGVKIEFMVEAGKVG